jgi:hypothetical protein
MGYGYGYGSNGAPNLGRPVEPLTPREGTTHVITIPGTTFRCFLGPEYMTPPAPVQGKWDWTTHTQAPDIQRPARVVALMKQLAARTIPGPGKRRVKCAPVLHTLEEWQALTTARKAA